ncbi:MAG: homocitrate synthase NifV [Clostridia bacterium]|nr:homocitrate synthase NifV [Clostridia bacterium]MDN5322305.1 homocitrate synthase NifV [Clostridia bacterium]
MKRKIIFVDSTLRDGEETAGVVFALREKVQIAKMLDEIGIDQIEVGIPIMGGDELEAIKQIVESNHRASIMAWNRPKIEDIDAAIKSGVDAVAISIPTSNIHIANKLGSTQSQVIHDMVAAVGYANSYGLYISVSAEDASRTDFDFLVRFAKAAKEAGANRLRYCDTVGLLDPITTYERIKALREAVDIDIEMHTHNNFGMATANAVAGITAGATHVNVTVNGLGERAGNAALEEVAMALKYVLDYKVSLNTTRFRELSDYVAQASNRQVPVWKAIVGSNMFTHSGRYSDGISRSPHAYEIFDPKEVGLERQIIIGKHSSAAALKQKFREYGTEISDEDAQNLLTRVRETCISLKRSLFDKELIFLYEEYLEQKSK